jgi:nucleoid-associated protein YgaU
MTARRRHREIAASGLVLLGIGCAAVAIAPEAQARSTQVWDRVASCESTDNWHINTGNGYYGGLQFSRSTWSGYRGEKYAARADLATKMEQIWVARRVLAAQGPDAWPVCGPRAGLNRGNGGATSSHLPNKSDERRAHHAARRHTHKTTHHARKHTGTVRHYRVRSGDTLSTIARRFHVAGGWHALYNDNRRTVHNPSELRVGQVLRVPR